MDIGQLAANLPAPLAQVRTRPLFVLRAEVRSIVAVGDTPDGHRRVGLVTGGSFTGERLSGVVLDGGSDWQHVRPDGATTLDVRVLLKAANGDVIGMSYHGLRHGPPEVMARIARGEEVEPGSYYFRINPMFEAPPGPHEWLNRVLAVGIGHRYPDGPLYSLFEVL